MEDVMINAAGSALGGPPGQVAGFLTVLGAKRAFRGVKVLPRVEKGQGYMSEMLEIITENVDLLSPKERDMLEVEETLAKGALARSLHASNYWARWHASREFKQLAKEGRAKAKTVSENAKWTVFENENKRRREEEAAAERRTKTSNSNKPMPTQSASSSAVLQASGASQQRATTYPPPNQSVKSIDSDPFRTPTGSVSRLSVYTMTDINYNDATFLDSSIQSHED